jgi:tetratricopeptide (TPR) repeat protein
MNIDDWIERCCTVADSLTTPPYLDAEISELEEALPFSRDGARREPELVQSFADVAESCLVRAPSDLGLRLAALYPLRRSALSNLFRGTTYWSSVVAKNEIEIFRHLACLCVPEKLGNLIELKFELHNMYLAADWNKAGELFSRLALLGSLEPVQMHAVRGQFWFLSVFGRQIEYEMTEDGLFCDWVSSLPDRRSRSPEFERFTRPEPLEEGSPQHWVLAAWCTNPRSPEPFSSPEVPTITDDGLLIDTMDMEGGAPDPAGIRDQILLSWHHRYRDFSPIKFPIVPEKLRDRLIMAVEDLREPAKLNKAFDARYCPIFARAQFALGNFSDAGAMFGRALAAAFAFDDSSGTREDYAWETRFSEAWAYHEAGQYQRAIETVKEGKISNPAWPGASWWIAKWNSECGNYKEAAEYLKSESENEFSPPESWLLSSVLALAGIAEEEHRAEKFVGLFERTNPEVFRLVRSLISENWAGFEKLQPESQARWLYATCETHRGALSPDFLAHGLRTAVREYGWVLENELMAGIFDPFRRDLIADAKLIAKSGEVHITHKNDPLLCFIHWVPHKITLGGMITALERSAHPSHVIEEALQRWLRDRFARIRHCIPAMKEVNAERTRATHGNPIYGRSNVLEVSSKCKRGLEWL